MPSATETLDASDDAEAASRPAGVDPTRRRRNLVFIVTALGAFMASLDLSIVNVAFPALERSFPHDSRASLAWVLTGYSIVFASLLVTAGRSADRLGRRRLFFVGLGIFTLGSALCGMAPSVDLLIAGRFIQGSGAAAMLPASLGLLLGAFPSERRSQVVALWGGIGALAVATGPSLGGLLVSGPGWRWVFFVNLPIGAIGYLVGRRVLTETATMTSGARPDYLGVVLVSSTLAALVLGITEGPTWGWTSGRIIICFVGAVVVGAAFLRRSAHHPEPVLDLTLFRSRSFSVANAATVLYAMGFFAMLLGNILFLTGVWHYSILRAGLAVTPGPLVVAVVSGPAGRVAQRIGFRTVLVVGFAFFAAGLTWYATAIGLHPSYVSRWLPATLITGLGIGLTFPVLSAAAVSSLHIERFGVGSAVNQTARQVGGAFGVALLVVILGTPRTPTAALVSFRHLWAFAAAMAVLSGLVTALLKRGRPSLTTAAPTPSEPESNRRIVSSLSKPVLPDTASDYDKAIAVTPSEGGWTVDLDGSWSIGGSMNGGYLLATMVNAATAAASLPDPLAVTATFLSPPTSGPAEITVSVVKHGRRSTVAELVLHQGGRDHVRATAVLGDLDGLTGPELDGVTSSVPPLAQCVSLQDRPGPGGIDAPEIFRHFDVRLAPDIGWLTGSREGSPGQGVARIEGWTCFTDQRQPDATSLMLFADAFPPAVLDRHRASWVPTLQYSVYVRARPQTTWLQGSFRTRSMVGGLLEEDGELFDSTGKLVALSRQLALLLPAT